MATKTKSSARAQPVVSPETIHDSIDTSESIRQALAAPDQEIVDIPIAVLVRHPDNRHPTPEAILRVHDSLIDHGQIEPCLVRSLRPSKSGPHERYQMLSGETRWLAMQRRGGKTIRARVLELDDAAALRLVAIANARRTDLNPIERAELLKRLTDPVDKGGGGLTQEQAAEDVGLSRAAVANEIRLLRLPEPILNDVRSGRLPATFARELIPLADGPAKSLLPKLYAGVAKQAAVHHARDKRPGPNSQFSLSDQHTRDSFVEDIERDLRRAARSLEPANKFERESNYHLGNLRYAGAAFFDPTPEQLAKLQVAEFAGKRFAINRKLWDELQKSAAAELLAKLKTKKKEKDEHANCGPGKSKAKSKPLTPAQVKAKSEADAKAHSEKIEADAKAHSEKISQFRDDWISDLIAEAFEAGPSKAPNKLAWLETRDRLLLLVPFDQFDLEHSLAKVDGKRSGLSWTRFAKLSGDQVDAVSVAMIAEGFRKGIDHEFDSKDLADIAKTLGIKLADAWRKNRAGHLTENFFDLFNAEQLRSLCVEWKIIADYAASAEQLREKLAKDKLSLVLPKCLKG